MGSYDAKGAERRLASCVDGVDVVCNGVWESCLSQELECGKGGQGNEDAV